MTRWRKGSCSRRRIRRLLKCSGSTADTPGKALELLASSRNCELSKKARSKLVSDGVSQAVFTGMVKGSVQVESKTLEATELESVVPSDRSSFGGSGDLAQY